MKFKAKKLLLTSCTKALRILKFKLKKHLLIKSISFRPKKTATPTSPNKKNTIFSKMRKAIRPLRKSREMDRVMQLKSFSSNIEASVWHHKAPCPSPLTPAYARLGTRNGDRDDGDVADACRTFENYLMAMVVEDGKMKDLMDVEELLYCWKNLKSPVFINLVCRFYGELCKDLFSSNN